VAEGIRIDKWLWATRFFKTRSLATRAVSGGAVHVNKQRVKPARLLQQGDILCLGKAPETRELIVLGMPGRRGPASEASSYYQETDESIVRRERDAEARKTDRLSVPRPEGRPDKRSRRKLIQLRGR
jgi:ribosome-associated heat shock protein Hsp15